MSSKAKVLYVGMTNDISRRVYEHKNKMNIGFTAKYNVDCLVYFEEVANKVSAIRREKQLKGWIRDKKIKLVEIQNPNWEDLSKPWLDELMGKEENK